MEKHNDLSMGEVEHKLGTIEHTEVLWELLDYYSAELITCEQRNNVKRIADYRWFVNHFSGLIMEYHKNS